MKITVLIANGPNSVKVPCMFFKTREEAEEFIFNLTGVKLNGKTSFAIDEVKNDEGDLMFTIREREVGPIGNKFEPEKLLEYYYGGCGEIYSFSLIEVEDKTPIAGFDLD